MDCSESFLLTAIRVAKEAEPAPPEAPPGWVPPCWQSPELFETPRWDWDLNTNLAWSRALQQTSSNSKELWIKLSSICKFLRIFWIAGWNKVSTYSCIINWIFSLSSVCINDRIRSNACLGSFRVHYEWRLSESRPLPYTCTTCLETLHYAFSPSI